MNRARSFWLALALAAVVASPAWAEQQQSTNDRSLSAPANLAAESGDGIATLKWAAVTGARGYRVFRTAAADTEAVFLTSVETTEFVAMGLDNGVAYRFHVAAYHDDQQGPFAVVSTTPISQEGGTLVRREGGTSVPPVPPEGGTLVAPAVATGMQGQQPVARSLQMTLAPTVDAPATTAPPPTAPSQQPRPEPVPVVTEVAASMPSSMPEPAVIESESPAIVAESPALVIDPVAPAPVVNVASDTLSTTTEVELPDVPPSAALAATTLTAKGGNKFVTLIWSAVPEATGYRIYRTTTGTFGTKSYASTSTAVTYTDWGVVNGTTYTYTVVPINTSGTGPQAAAAAATPVTPPVTPTGLAASAGDKQVTLTWTAVSGATSYAIYRSTSSNPQTVLTRGVTAATFLDSGVENGPTYYYKVSAANAGGESSRSTEASGSPTGPAAGLDASKLAAHRLLRQATWGPRPGDVAALEKMGGEAFIDEQLAAAPSQYPDILLTLGTDVLRSHWVNLALTGEDQLRQRVAWALHKIWVVSGVEVTSTAALVNYHRILINNAFGNYRDVMEQITLSPAMGRYLNMLNSRSAHLAGAPANENYARELMQLFTLGIPTLRPDGVAFVDDGGDDVQSYTETDVKELARILTGWTFGDGNPATVPTRAGSENYRVPMEAVAAYHDVGDKTFLGMAFPAGQSARADLTQALDLVFRHPNLGPFVSRQLIQQLVTSNPSPGYVWSIASVFDDNGQGVRGDLAAVVKAILMHPLASQDGPDPGKLAEPALFALSWLRVLNPAVVNPRFIIDGASNMGQRVLFPPSVFSYFSPGFRVRAAMGRDGKPLVGPEFQGLTTVTTQARINFVAQVLGDWYTSSMIVDYTPFTSRAADPAVLVDYCSEMFMGTRMPLDIRNEIIAAVRVTSASNLLERVRTAIYLTVTAALQQVD